MFVLTFWWSGKNSWHLKYKKNLFTRNFVNVLIWFWKYSFMKTTLPSPNFPSFDFCLFERTDFRLTFIESINSKLFRTKKKRYFFNHLFPYFHAFPLYFPFLYWFLAHWWTLHVNVYSYLKGRKKPDMCITEE